MPAPFTAAKAIAACARAMGAKKYRVLFPDGTTETFDTAPEAAEACESVDACGIHFLGEEAEVLAAATLVNDHTLSLGDRFADFTPNLSAVLDFS